jgi:polar amino acid transport system ATP-binding protein
MSDTMMAKERALNDDKAMSGTQPMLVARNIRKTVPGLTILDGVDLDVERGEVVVLMGKSGSGKTTLLRCINRLEEYEGGSISLEGEPIGYRETGGRRVADPERLLNRSRAQIGMVFQHFNLFRHMTALENVMEGLVTVKGMKKAEATALARKYIAKVALGEKEALRPKFLSGGQKQRIAIARALAMEPKLMLFDEPTSALDPELVDEVLNTIRALAAEGTTMIVVTHEMSFARDVADKIVFMEKGRVVEAGRPEIFFGNNASPRIREFFGRNGQALAGDDTRRA